VVIGITQCQALRQRGIPNVRYFLFTIEALEAAPREGEECAPAYLEKAQAALDAYQTGITFKYVQAEYTSGLEVADKPASLSLEQTQAILASQDFYLDLHGLRGPWVFELAIE
jgi:hypothetical protein